MLSILHLLSHSSGKVQSECLGLNAAFMIVESAVSVALGTAEVSSSVSLLTSSGVTLSQGHVTEACHSD